MLIISRKPQKQELVNLQGCRTAGGDPAGTGPRGGAAKGEGPERASVQGTPRGDRTKPSAPGERQKGEGAQPADPRRVGAREGDEGQGEKVAVTGDAFGGSSGSLRSSNIFWAETSVESCAGGESVRTRHTMSVKSACMLYVSQLRSLECMQRIF